VGTFSETQRSWMTIVAKLYIQRSQHVVCRVVDVWSGIWWWSAGVKERSRPTTAGREDHKQFNSWTEKCSPHLQTCSRWNKVKSVQLVL